MPSFSSMGFIFINRREKTFNYTFDRMICCTESLKSKITD